MNPHEKFKKEGGKRLSPFEIFVIESLEIIMATQADVLAAVSTVSGKIDAATTRVVAAIAAAAQPIDEQPVFDAVNALGAKADAIAPPTA